MAINMRNLWNDLSTAGTAPPTGKAPDAPACGLELPSDWQDSPPVDGPFPITPPKPAAPVLESITLIPNKTSIAVGESVQISVMGKFSDGTSRPVTGECMWSGGPSSVLQVSGNGSATGMSVGSASITAVHTKYTSISNSTKIAVTGAGPKPPEPVLEQIILDPGGYDVMSGAPVQFRATGKFPGWPDEDLTNVVVWSSNKPEVAAVIGNGIVTTKGPGTAIITASYAKHKATATVTVRGGDQPKPQTRTLMVVPPGAYIAIGEPVIFTARRLRPDGTAGEIVTDVKWSHMPAADIVMFAPSQHLVHVTGKSAGVVRIIATESTGIGEAIVTVKPEKLVGQAPDSTSTIKGANDQAGASPNKPMPPTPTKEERPEIIPQLPDQPPPGPPAPPPSPSGKSNEIIKGLQKSLKKVGYDPGPPDGIMGKRTSEALKQFQRDNGLAADGVAGPATQAAMAKALRAANAGGATSPGGGGGTLPQTGTATLEVHIHDESGKPVDGVTVRLSTGPTPKPDATTNAAGIVRFEGLADGDYHVNAAKRNIVWQPGYVKQSKLAPGQTFVMTLSKLAKPGAAVGTLKVTVTYAGFPEPDTAVRAMAGFEGGPLLTGQTNASGSFVFTGAPAGEYRVSAIQSARNLTGASNAQVQANATSAVSITLGTGGF